MEVQNERFVMIPTDNQLYLIFNFRLKFYFYFTNRIKFTIDNRIMFTLSTSIYLLYVCKNYYQIN
jgi:hypothetical protein